MHCRLLTRAIEHTCASDYTSKGLVNNLSKKFIRRHYLFTTEPNAIWNKLLSFDHSCYGLFFSEIDNFSIHNLLLKLPCSLTFLFKLNEYFTFCHIFTMSVTRRGSRGWTSGISPPLKLNIFWWQLLMRT